MGNGKDNLERRQPSRRDVLAAGLSCVPASLLAGCGGQGSLPFSGTIVGPNVAAGHQLRDSRSSEKDKQPDANTELRQTDVVIVGGGIAGLTAARELKQRGIEKFVVLDLESTSGGTSRYGESPAIRFPWGAHYLPLPMATNRALLDLLDEMEVISHYTADGEPVAFEQYLCRDPEERLFINGHWQEGVYPWDGATSTDENQLNAFRREINRWSSWRDNDGQRAFSIPLATCSRDEEVIRLDSISMEQWLNERDLTSKRLRWYIDYACRDDYGLSLEQTSAWAAIFYFAARQVSAEEESRPLLTWPEGNGRFVEYLSHLVADHLETNRLVTAIRQSVPHSNRDDQRRWLVDATSTSEPDSRVRIECRSVIYAAPQFTVPYVVHVDDAMMASRSSSFSYGAWLVANLSLKDRPSENGFALAWDNVIYESPSLGYVVATHQAGIDHGPTVLTYYYAFCHDDPRQAREELLRLSWHDCARLVVNDLRSAHPEIEQLVDRLDVMKWGHAMIQPRPGFVWSTDRQTASQSLQGLCFANTDLSGIALFEEAFYHGQRAANESIDWINSTA